MINITLQKDVLSKAINTANKAVSANPIVPLLSNLLIESNNGNSRVAGTNFEIGISYSFPLKGEAFRICAPARTLASLVDIIGSEEIDLQLDLVNQSVIIMTESSTSNLKCMPAEEFPDIPKVTDANLSLPVGQFKEMVQRVALSASAEEGSVLGGVLLTTELEQGKERFVMFAADRARMSLEWTSNLGFQGASFNVIIKGTTLETISRTLPDEGELEIEADEKKIMFRCGNIDIVAQLMDGKFPDYKLLAGAIPTATTTLNLSTLELLRACRQLRIFASEVGSSKMEIQGMLMRYSSLAMERGDSDINLMVAKTGDDLTIALNVHFLQEFLEVCKTDQVVIEFAGSKAPILLKMRDFQEFYHVIMPLNPG